MEIGSFIELELKNCGEYYSGENVLALNSGRAGIYHAARTLGCETVWLPYYQCPSVREFLLKMGLGVKYYCIDKSFNPINLNPGDGEAAVIVNYFGVMSEERIFSLAQRYKNVIVDNSQGFFAPPVKDCLNVYSARKFVGVPDGAYVIGKGVKSYSGYGQDYSSDTADFLLMRIERGCEGETYAHRRKNEERIASSPPLLMSALTKALLKSTDYENNKRKRRENFDAASEIFKSINKIDPKIYYDGECVPMVYPLVVEDEGLLEHLLKNKIFQGRWWSYLIKEMAESSFEYYLSSYMIPVTIDQRYSKQELLYTYNLVKGYLKE